MATVQRVRFKRHGRDHLETRGRTLCNIKTARKKRLPVKGGILCVECRKQWRVMYGDNPPPGYEGHNERAAEWADVGRVS
jgi:hypothetical protein